MQYLIRKISMIVLLSAAISSGASETRAAANCASYSGNARLECQLKENFTFQATTAWPGPADNVYGTTNSAGTLKYYFVSGAGSSVLNTGVKCDGVYLSPNNYKGKNPCDANTVHTDDFIKSDDLDKESNFTLPSQNFTLEAYDTDSSGISSIRIEWAASASKTSVPTSWAGGYTCNSSMLSANGGRCKVCREGTACANGSASLPVSFLSIQPNGAQNNLYLRVIITDNSGVTLTIGGDNQTSDPYKSTWVSSNLPFYQDKAYQLQICDTGCSATCAAAHTVSSATASNANCALGTPYTLSWNLSAAGQSAYILNVTDASTGAAVYNSGIVSASTAGSSYSVTPANLKVGGLLSPSKTYNWEVRVLDSVASPCAQWTPYKAGTAFTTCALGCTKVAPTINNNGATGPAAGMCGATDPGPFYQLKWSYSNMPVGASQTSAVVTVTNTVDASDTHSATIAGNSTTYAIPTGWIQFGGVYKWSVKPTVSDAASCTWSSASSAWSNFTVDAAYPNPSYTVKNYAGLDCLSGACHTNETISFAAASPNGGTAYAWSITGEPDPTGANYSKVFTSEMPYTVNVTVSDGTRSCSATAGSFTLTPASCLSLNFAASLYSPSNAGLCRAGLNDTDGFYSLSWGASNLPVDAKASDWRVTVKDSGGAVVGVSDPDGSLNPAKTYFNLPTSWFSPSSSYSWELSVNYGDGGGCGCQGCKWTKTASGSFTTPGPYPTTAFTVKNGGAQDCLAPGNCHAYEPLSFDATAANGGSGFNWTIWGEAAANGPNLTRIYTDTNNRSLSVTASNANGSCSASGTVLLTASACNSLTTSADATYAPTDLCTGGLDNDDGYYSVSFSTNNGTYAQTGYTVTLRDAATKAVLHTRSVGGNGTNFAIPYDWLAWDKGYEWSVYANFSDGAGCSVASAASGWTAFAVPHAYPVPDIKVSSASSPDCSAGGCHVGEDLTFDATGSSNATGGAYYDWTLSEGTTATSTSFAKPLPDQITYTANLTVKDYDDRACSASKIFALGGPLCASSPSVVLFAPTLYGDYCSNFNYLLGWQLKDSGSSTQKSYDIEVVDVGTGASYPYALSSSATPQYVVPLALSMNYGKTYKWRVTVHADDGGSCAMDVASDWSTLTGMDFSTPVHPYPTLNYSITKTDDSTQNCLSGQCHVSDDVTFNAGGSSVSTLPATYEWVVDGAVFDTPFFSVPLTSKDHVYSLTVTDQDNASHSCTDSNVALTLGGAKIKWNEIAP